MGVFDRLVKLLRPDLDALVECPVCGQGVRRRDAIGGCCTLDHFQERQDQTAL